MKKNYYNLRIVIFFTILFFILNIQNSRSQTICIQPGTSDQRTGVQDGYRYELWNQNAKGTACMTLGKGALFSGNWDGILNYLARRGLGYNKTQEHQEIGRFYSKYNCDYKPSSASGNSYLSIYGWTVEPLIEYYIVEDWRNWIPSMAGGVTSKGSFTVNGSVYDVYVNTRVNEPSIVGTATFQQYFSIRRDKRNSGTINISDHFEKWEELGLEMGKLHEVSFVVEGYQSSGSFQLKELDVYATDEVITGMGEKEISKSVVVYPNPSTGNLSIHLEKHLINSNVEIYDTLGKIIFSRKNIKDQQIELSDLKSGLYYVNVRDNRNNHTSKVLVF